MNTLIDPLKRIARDLVDRKLWPVAAVLLVAIIAVPLLIGGSSSEDAAAPLTANAPAAPGSQSLVTVVDPAAAGKDTRPGRLDDPFYDPPAPPAAADSSPAAGTPAAGEAPAGGSAGTAPAGAQPGPATAPQPPAEPVAAPVYYSTVVRWWESKPSKARPIRRLTPFGGLADTAALYLGVAKSGANYAVFLLGPNATSEGEGRCDDTACRVVGLKAGQTQIVTVQPADGGEARQYNLDVVSVKSATADAATVRTMRARVHIDGRDAMREMWSDAPTAAALRPIKYDRDSGLLVRSAAAAGAAGAAAVTAQQPAGGPAAATAQEPAR